MSFSNLCRSKTQLTAEVLECAKNLQVIGCFCIGTNQVNLEYAASRGIAVFNSPFSNSRSVAEMMIAQIIALSRQMTDRNTELHQGKWNKVEIILLLGTCHTKIIISLSLFSLPQTAMKSGANRWELLGTDTLDPSYPF